MSNIATLPLIQVAGSVEGNEDLTFALTFTLADAVTPLPLAGIAFTLEINHLTGETLFTGSTSNATLAIGGTSGNILTCTIREAVTATWPVGGYLMTLIATDGVATKGVFADSSLVVGETEAWAFMVVMPSGATATGLTGAGDIPPVTTIVSASQTISVSGTYIVTQTGVTLTLNPAATVNGSVVIKDMTGNANPNITVSGAIDGGSSVVMSTAYQAIILAPVAALSIWARI